jgi:rod shape-determining protein MreD
MPLWILVPLLALVAMIQITLLPPLPLVGVKPELALALVVTWAMLAPMGEAAVWGFILGVCLDLASGLPFGMHTLALTLLGWVIGWVPTTFFRGNLLAPPLAMMLATLVYHTILLGFLALFNTPIDWLAYLGRVTLPTALVNTLALPLLYLPLLAYSERQVAYRHKP